jgi:molybdopterin-binding protein
MMEISARNQLKGAIRAVKLGTIMSEVAVDIGGQQIAAAITRGSTERLGLQEGADVTVIIKATEVMIATGS